MSLLGLVPSPPAQITGSAVFEGRELIGMSRSELRSVRGPGIGMVFQDPMTSLNPVLTIGRQITESLEAHMGLRGARSEEHTSELQSLMRISYAVFFLQKKQQNNK